MSIEDTGAAISEAELDALVERHQRYPGAFAVDSWKFYCQLLEEIQRAEHPDITDSHGRVWTWFPIGAWTDANDPCYSHCGVVAAAAEIFRWGFPHPRLADNPNYDLCEICKRDWPEWAKAEYGIWYDGYLWPNPAFPGEIARAVRFRTQGLFASPDHRFARLVKKQGGEWVDVSERDFPDPDADVRPPFNWAAGEVS